MIELTTGLPGSGKSLTAVERISKERKAEVPRPIYVYGIDGLKPGLAIEMSDPLDWQSCPDGSLIIIDEAQKVFPLRRGGGEPIPPIVALTEHRHRGFDFLLLTQHPNLLDVYVRRLVGRHVHILRRFGGNTCQRLIWGECVDDPQSLGTRARGSTELWRYPKDIFDLYKSATLHTHKRRLPLRLLLIPIVLAVLIVSGFVINRFMDSPVAKHDSSKSVSSAAPSKVQGESFFRPPSAVAPKFDTVEAYVTAHIPRVDGRPYSAPVFDHRAAVAEPRYYCASTSHKCTCLTEQGTRAKVDYVRCRTIAVDGYYDPYLAPREDQPMQSNSEASASPTAKARASVLASDGRSVDVQSSSVRTFDHASAGQIGRYTHLPAEPAL